MPSSPALSSDRQHEIERYSARLRELRSELSRLIVGQEEVLHQIIVTLLAEGHALLIGVPGLAKTLMVRSLAELISLDFKRIQFTPDLMPSDITGATVIRRDATGRRDFHFLRGPIFTNILLADEINRTPPKSQAALMEAMEERQVTASGRRLPVDRPFFVLATQNPIEQQGTYPLPVSQLDRFLLSISVDYPDADEEFTIVLRTTSSYEAKLEPMLGRDEVIAMIDLVRGINVSPAMLEYAAQIVRRTRPQESDAPESIRRSAAWGAGPRAVQALLATARGNAFLAGRPEVTPDDFHAVARAVLRHRLVLNYHSEAEGVRAED
ncbi:MAG TPA: MoxR family ATPase, partial [Planctomycetota bacterium]|nr:MoxR family ATPase [Planctomycetota bacterium]